MRRNTPAMVLVHSARLQKQLFPIRIPKTHGICVTDERESRFVDTLKYPLSRPHPHWHKKVLL